MSRASLREATLADLDVLVRHRRNMWEELGEFPREELDSQDRVYRRWARVRLQSGRLVGFIVETDGGHVAASGCLWLSPSQPRPAWSGIVVPYLMSMYTEREERGRGHATRVVRAAVRWAEAHGFEVVILHASDEGKGIYESAGFRSTTEMRLHLDRARGLENARRRPQARPRRRHR